MPRIVKNTLLSYIPLDLKTEETVNPVRIYTINNVKNNGDYVVYLCEREIRAKDNFALQFSISLSNKFKLPLKILCTKPQFECLNKHIFISKQIDDVKKNFENNNFDFKLITQSSIVNEINNLNPKILIIDFCPILDRSKLKTIKTQIYEVDGHNIVPARYVSNKQEYSAATFRPKIYYSIYPFLTKFNNMINYTSEADLVLKDFIQNKLNYYSAQKNNPNENILSGLSKYLNFGFISSQRIAIEVIKSSASPKNKEAFLEELIIRKELADNFCLYCKMFKTIECAPTWARVSLLAHKSDIRSYIYSLDDLEKANTNDDLWNATQKELMNKGKIHGYLRMYWAKKISEWTVSPNEAIKTAIYLNDKYAYDAPSSNGYVGILWAIAGLHDRAFSDYTVTGKIRRMTYKSVKTKFDTFRYIKNNM